MDKDESLLPVERIASCILVVRGQKVMLDEDLAALYGVETGRLVEAVKRNIERFPREFMFQLIYQEVRSLISQIAIARLPDIAYRSATGDSLHITPVSPIS